ncbi:MAG: tetratricopeptide repeat protein [Gammaproteobacteria bacterium]|nr:tetratricopeptide repeat protein [Gammaproteobacteria bacterium]
MNRLIIITTLALTILLVGCSGGSGYRDPAPVTSGQDGGGSGAVVSAYQAPRSLEIKPTYSSPVEELLRLSKQQQGEGNTVAAVASVERALRIEPRNAYLWNRLARLRLEQGQGSRAVELAAKSRSLAGADNQLKADNWRLIAKVRQQSGDTAGARRAVHEAVLLGE